MQLIRVSCVSTFFWTRATYYYGWCTIFVVDNLNVLQWSSSTLTWHLETLEHGFLSAPLTGKAGLWVGCFAAVGNLLRSEVALNKGVIVDVDGMNILDIDTWVGVAPGL